MPVETREVLLVEDNAAEVDLVREALEGMPIRLRVTADPAQAYSLLRQGALRPDVVLLDLHLPSWHGRGLLRAIKQDEHLRVIPVVVFTGSRAPEDVEACYREYANCYVVKPSRLDQYLDTVRAVARYWCEVAERAAPEGGPDVGGSNCPLDSARGRQPG